MGSSSGAAAHIVSRLSPPLIVPVAVFPRRKEGRGIPHLFLGTNDNDLRPSVNKNILFLFPLRPSSFNYPTDLFYDRKTHSTVDTPPG